MKTILLLGGRSRRFWPLKDKYLFPLLGKTVLEHQIDRLKEAGCTDLILVAGAHNIKEIRALRTDASVVLQKDAEGGMQAALLSALPRCKKEPVLIVGSDFVDPAVYRELQTKMAKDKKLDGLILARKMKQSFPGGYIKLKGKRVVEIVEKPPRGKEPSDLVTIVAHAHRDASVLLSTLREIRSKNDDGYEVALTHLFRNHHYEALRYSGPWQPVKYPWHLLGLLPMLLGALTKQSIDRSAAVHPSAVIEGPVTVAEHARILPNAVIVGPAYIGPYAIIGNNALVRGSSVGGHSVVGYNTEVKGGAFADHVWTHSSYLGESIVGSNVAFGGGSVTGNLRLDEEEIASQVGGEHVPTGLRKFGTIIGPDVRVGIHTSINPGIKIGAGSFISSAVLVDRDVPNDSFVSMKNGAMHVRPNTTRVPKPEGRGEFRKKL